MAAGHNLDLTALDPSSVNQTSLYDTCTHDLHLAPPPDGDLLRHGFRRGRSGGRFRSRALLEEVRFTIAGRNGPTGSNFTTLQAHGAGGRERNFTPTGRTARINPAACQRECFPIHLDATARTCGAAHIHLTVLQADLTTRYLHLPARQEHLSRLKHHMATLGIQQEALLHREQAAGESDVAVALQRQGRKSGRITDQTRTTPHRLTRKQSGLISRGAEHIKHPTPKAKPGGRAQLQMLHILKATGTTEGDAPG